MAHRLGVQPRAAVGQIVSGDARDGRVPQAHGGDTLGDPARLVAVQLSRLAGVDLAEVAATGALLAADQERRLPVLPALVDVGAAGFLADGVQTLTADQILQLRVLGARLHPGLDPRRLALDRSLRVADFETQQLPAFRSDGHDVNATRSRPSSASHTAAVDAVDDVVDADVTAEFCRQRSDPGVGDAARHDRGERAQVAVAVQREPVQRGRPRHPDPDRADLAGRAPVVGRHPHTRSARDAHGFQSELGAHMDQRLFKAPNEIHHVEWFGQADDRIADQLTRAVPGDLAAPVGVDHGRAVGRTLLAAACDGPP